MTPFTVERLLEPFSIAQFCDAYYEKRPLFLSRRSPSYYDGLLTLDELNDVLGQANLLSTEVRLVRRGRQMEDEDFTWPDSSGNTRYADATIDKEAMFARFYEGYTIAISSFERHNAAVLHLRHDFERVFHAPVMAGAFLTPRNAQGFGAHPDREDTFFLQFAGTKEWIIHDRSRKRLMTATLEPGDLLYLPSGFFHKGCSADAVSGHVTFGLVKFTYADLLRQIADT